MNGPGLSYKVGVCIKTTHIVWVNGPFVASTNYEIVAQSSEIGYQTCYERTKLGAKTKR